MRAHRLLPVVLALLPGGAAAQSFPGDVPDALAGDWSCGETRVYLTGLGSIEVLGEDSRAGLVDAADGRLEIEWDGGGRETWRYAADGGTGLTLDDGAGTVLSCVLRE